MPVEDRSETLMFSTLHEKKLSEKASWLQYEQIVAEIEGLEVAKIRLEVELNLHGPTYNESWQVMRQEELLTTIHTIDYMLSRKERAFADYAQIERGAIRYGTEV